MSEPHPSHIRATSEPHPSHIRTTSEPHQGRALYGPMPVKTETFRELWAPLVHTNFGGNSYGLIIGPYLFLGKFIWTNGPESSSKVSPTLVLVHGRLFPAHPNHIRSFAEVEGKEASSNPKTCPSHIWTTRGICKCRFVLLLKRHFRDMSVWIAILRACYRARKPPNPENTKKYKIPHPGLTPGNTEKIPKKYKNGPKIAVFGPFPYFFGIFSVFWGANPGWGDFVFFSYFRALGVFGLCSRPARSQCLEVVWALF